MFTRFTNRSRRAMEAAFEEARALGHDSLGDEDLLLGILSVDDGIAAEALSSLGVSLQGAREESDRMTSEALAAVGISLEEIRREAGDAFEMRLPDDRKIPLSPRAKNALVEARKEMRRLAGDHFGAEHVLLGVLGNEDGTAVSLLGAWAPGRRRWTPGSASCAGGRLERVEAPSTTRKPWKPWTCFTAQGA
jgi:ATP-dependent Clp protease ATP-binding subunit ClpC